jgi:hypothetical protein
MGGSPGQGDIIPLLLVIDPDHARIQERVGLNSTFEPEGEALLSRALSKPLVHYT